METTNWKEWFMMVLAIIIVLGVLGSIVILMYVDMPEDNRDALYLVLGTIIAGFSTVVGYFFGSSKGSSEKTAILNEKNKTENNETV